MSFEEEDLDLGRRRKGMVDTGFCFCYDGLNTNQCAYRWSSGDERTKIWIPAGMVKLGKLVKELDSEFGLLFMYTCTLLAYKHSHIIVSQSS